MAVSRRSWATSTNTEQQPDLPNLPYNEEAETGLIGCLLFDNRCFDSVAHLVSAEMFMVEAHRRCYTVIAKLLQRGMHADPLTIKNYFDQDNSLSDVGGIAYFKRVLAATVTTVNAPDYARSIRECYVRRQIIIQANEAIRKASEFDTDASEQLDDLQQELTALGDLNAETYKPKTVAQAAAEAMDQTAAAEQRGTGINGTRTGYIGIDKMLGGLVPGAVYVVGGRTSMGKTALARGIANNVARATAAGEPNAGPVVYFSMEMSAVQMAYGIIAPQVRIPASNLMAGAVGGPESWLKISEAQAALDAVPLIFDDRPGLSVTEMLVMAKRVKRERKGLGLIVVDLLGHVKAPTAKAGKSDPLHDTMLGIIQMAKQLAVPVLVLHQLSRLTESRDDHRPTLSDLRDSGAIEQDADVVMLVYREHYYLTRAKPQQRERETNDAFAAREADWYDDCQRSEHVGEIIIAKNRLTGPTGTVKLYWDGQFATFSNRHDEDRQERLGGL